MSNRMSPEDRYYQDTYFSRYKDSLGRGSMFPTLTEIKNDPRELYRAPLNQAKFELDQGINTWRYWDDSGVRKLAQKNAYARERDTLLKAAQQSGGEVNTSQIRKQAMKASQEGAEQFMQSGLGKTLNVGAHLPGKLLNTVQAVQAPLELGMRLTSGQDPIEAVGRTAVGTAGAYAGGSLGGSLGTTAGTAIGVALAPFTAGASIPIGATAGGLLGSIGGGILGNMAAHKLADPVLGNEEENAAKRQLKQAQQSMQQDSIESPDRLYGQPSNQLDVRHLATQADDYGVRQMEYLEGLNRQTQELEVARQSMFRDIKPQRYSFVYQ